MSASWLRMDLSLLASRDLRVLFGSRTVTLLGTEATDVALVVQVKQLTGSTLAVGLLGAAELVPLVVFALYGGVLADRLDWRRVIRWCEAALGVCALVVAGAADMVSGIFRDLLGKQTIPDALRGRLAGVELLSYAVGPSAGQLRAGAVASATTTRFSLVSGGVLCVGAVGLVCLALPAFTHYQAPVPEATQSNRESRAQSL